MEALDPQRMGVMAAPRKYPDELREHAVRLVVDAKKDPVTRPAACWRIAERLGIRRSACTR
jgi:transposase